MAPLPRLTVRALGPDQWPALDDLFCDSAVCRRCWCMYWRIGSAYRKQPPARNKAAFRKVVAKGPPPGLLAFDGDVAVAWCQLTPRDALPWLDRDRRLARVDGVPVWSLSCFSSCALRALAQGCVRKGYRRQVVTSLLIAAALKAAKQAGAPALEAYPLDRDETPSATSTGVVTTFQRAGFETVACRAPPRPIMRHDLD